MGQISMQTIRFRTHTLAISFLGASASLLAGCDEPGLVASDERARATIPATTLAMMESKGTTQSAPVLIRAYKKEAELEIWKMKPDGRYVHLKTFPMCRWSGQLGPKAREGDRQVPEGFYAITPAQMNPKSAYYLSFNVGYPNVYDRAMGRGGGAIMVHGACSSAGCFSMTDKQIAEIYAIAREGFSGGQRSIQMQSYPFRMTAENLAKYRLDPNIAFWKQLKDGADNFEVTKQEVAVNVCNKQYVFNASAADGSHLDPGSTCPVLKYNTARAEVVSKQKRDDAKIAELVAQGTKPVRTIYADGGQHPEFASRFPNVSRADALTQEPIDVALDDSIGRKGSSSALVQVASLGTSAVPAPVASAKSARTQTASAPTSEPTKSQDSWLGLGRWFGGSQSGATKPAAAQVTAGTSDTSKQAQAPIPPRRNETGTATASRDVSQAQGQAQGQAATASTASSRTTAQSAARPVTSGASTTVAQAPTTPTH
jgi:murein L,D-transpeptidase YafK